MTALAFEPETAWIVSVSTAPGAVNTPLLVIVPVPLRTDHVAEVTADPEYAVNCAIEGWPPLTDSGMVADPG
jgi:hypothetical protein